MTPTIAALSEAQKALQEAWNTCETLPEIYFTPDEAVHLVSAIRVQVIEECAQIAEEEAAMHQSTVLSGDNAEAKDRKFARTRTAMQIAARLRERGQHLLERKDA